MTPSPLQRFKQHALWLLLAFFVALTFFTARNLTEKYLERDSARMIHSWTEISIAVNQLVHELQKERGLSSGLLSSGGRYFDLALTGQRKETDAAMERLTAMLGSRDGPASRLTQPFQEIRERYAELPALRLRVDALTVSRDAAVDFFVSMIEMLFDHQLATMSIGRSGWIYRQQMAFIFFLQAKEMAGQERALVTAMLSVADFSPMRMAALHRIMAVEQARAEKFVSLAQPDILDDYRRLGSEPYMAAVERIRRLVVAIGASQRQPEGRLPSSGLWFDMATRRIDALGRFEEVLADRLLSSAKTLEREAHWALWVNALAVLVSIALAGGLLVQIWRGKEFAEKNLHLADAVFDNSVEAIMIADSDANIIQVNPAFTLITGYAADEVVGRNPSIIKSGRHGRDFYEAMWRRIAATGSWEGEIWNRRKNGDIFPGLLSIVAVKNAQGELANYIAMTVDLSKYKETEALLEQLRSFDPLTGLPNRDSWQSAINQAIVNARRSDSRFAVLDIGLDRFRLINESLGHAVGDDVLVEVAERIKTVLRRNDVAARSSGDRFAVLLPDLAEPKAIGIFCERLLAAFQPQVESHGHSLYVTASIGVALYPDDGADAQALLQNAETALHAAKKEGSACYAFYSEEMNAIGAQLLTLERMLRQALMQKEFSLVYQPQVNAGSSQLVGVEVLLRWNNPTLGHVSPVQFIPIAEATGLIVPIGEWVLREACAQVRRWHDALGLLVPIAVNLSARQFRREDLMTTVQLALDESALPARCLELEITEGSLMSDPQGAAVILDGLRWMGVRVALDDFGTGYSSLAYLKSFPLDRLKLDRAFVKDLPENVSDKAIARTVILLGHNLGLQVLAEGVETAEQTDFLAENGCDVFQGYFHGKPMSAEDIAEGIVSGKWILSGI